MTSTTTTRPKEIFIFDNARNRSHLFFRLLATHPQLETVHHPYVNVGCMGPGLEKITYKIQTDNPRRMALTKETWEPVLCSDSYTWANAERDLLDSIAAIEKKGKIPLINEHCSYMLKRDEIHVLGIKARKIPEEALQLANPTILPDELWRSITPIIVIRHPAFALPSLHRATCGVPALEGLDPRENHNYWFATLSWSRLIFESLKRQGRTPLVVDGEDICTRTDEVIKAVCKWLGFDPADVKDTWSPWGQEWADKMSNPLFVEMTRTTWESDGVHKHAAKPVSIDDQVAKFKKDFGAEKAAEMKEAIEAQMDDYRFLEQFKV